MDLESAYDFINNLTTIVSKETKIKKICPDCGIYKETEAYKCKCDYEDDYFMYKCAKSGSKYIKLNDITVIHISHPFSQNSCSNIIRYHNLLKSE